jgi:endonuclease YncB( thermonuclease family)
MGTVHKFKRPPKNQQQFRGYRPRPPRGPRRRGPRWWQGKWLGKWLGLVIIAALSIGLGTLGSMPSGAQASTFSCRVSSVTDGDTLRCGDRRVRLYGIDAPELPGHCRPGRSCTPGDPYASTANLRALVGASTLQCDSKGIDTYGRTLARCSAGSQDLSCGQIKGGFAVRRYGWIWC